MGRTTNLNKLTIGAGLALTIFSLSTAVAAQQPGAASSTASTLTAMSQVTGDRVFRSLADLASHRADTARAAGRTAEADAWMRRSGGFTSLARSRFGAMPATDALRSAATAWKRAWDQRPGEDAGKVAIATGYIEVLQDVAAQLERGGRITVHWPQAFLHAADPQTAPNALPEITDGGGPDLRSAAESPESHPVAQPAAAPAEGGRFAIVGAVEREGQYPYQQAMLGQVLEAAGLKTNAERGGIVLLRGGLFDVKSASKIKYDYSKVLKGEAEDVALLPGDVVLVPVHRRRDFFTDTWRGITRFVTRIPSYVGKLLPLAVAAHPALGAAAGYIPRPSGGSPSRSTPAEAIIRSLIHRR